MGQTASYFGLSIEDLCGTSRSRVPVTARHIAMYLCRDHTTVINADRKIRSLMAERQLIYTQVTDLTNRIKQQAWGRAASATVHICAQFVDNILAEFRITGRQAESPAVRHSGPLAVPRPRTPPVRSKRPAGLRRHRFSPSIHRTYDYDGSVRRKKRTPRGQGAGR
jgi:Bacterial dnaA protein helix-turn-helix